MTHFMAYVILLSAGIAASALLAHLVLRSRTDSTRWLWVASLAAVVIVASVATFTPLPVAEEAPIASGPAISIDEKASTPSVIRAEPNVFRSALLVADDLLPAAWLLTSLFLLAAILYGQRRLLIERGASKRAHVNGRYVLLTENIGPAVAGVGQPVVLLPRWVLALDAASQELLLAHEFEHVKRGDTRLLLTGAVATALLPWNPVVWWIARRLRLAVEQDCDARVLRAHPDVRRYADLLLMAASKPRVSTRLLAAHLGEHRSDLDRRIQAMTDKRLNWRLTLTAAVVAAALIATSCEAPRPEPVAPLGTREPSPTPSTGTEGVSSPAMFPGSRMLLGSKMPKYPEILREAGVEGEVLVSFVIDETGKADVATFKVIKATHELFAMAVREALPEMRFTPAERDGRKVKFTVQEPFTFTIAGTGPKERAARKLEEIAVTGVESKLPTIVLRRDGEKFLTDPPHIVVFSFEGKEIARGDFLFKEIDPQSIHSIEVYKPNRCPAGATCPLIKITLAKGKTLGGPISVRPKLDESARDAWEPKAYSRRTNRPNLDSIMSAPNTVDLLNSYGQLVARYETRRAASAAGINGEDISASEHLAGKYCKAGLPCPVTRIWLKPGRETAYRKQG